VVPGPLPADWSLAELLAHLGDIPPDRVRLVPPPGAATEEDALAAKSRYGRICELVDGVLVDKPMGFYEAALAAVLVQLLGAFVARQKSGLVTGPDGTLRLLPGQIRIPDVSFIRWERFGGQAVSSSPAPAVAPDLAVEVLSPGNTPGEMERKLREYFQAGVRLVWYIDPRTKSARVFTAPDAVTLIGEDGLLDGGEVLPGFQLRLADLFAQVQSPHTPEA
jgi:Uma2 family endonuclease